MAEWQKEQIGDLVDRGVLWISDGYRVRNEELGPEGIPFVRGGDIGDGWINTSTEDHIKPEFIGRVGKKLTQPEDAAFITKGTVGRAGRLRIGQPPVVFAPQVSYWRVKDREVLDPGFIYYLIRSHEFQAALNGVKTHGSMVADYVSISQQLDFSFRFPGIYEQRAIAHILGTLDDKIELNRRMSESLEAMARALFKSWFVDFEPVRAKMEGRDPGLPKHLADLFPDRLVDSELGEIPEGWEVVTVTAIAEVIDCMHSKKPERCASGLPLLQLANIRDDGLLDMGDTYLIAEADYKQWTSRMEASQGDCVITNVGRVGAVSQIPSNLKAALGRNMTGIRCRRSFPFPTVLLECLLSQAMKEEITTKMDAGTILDALNVRSIPKLRFVLAASPILNSFERLARPLRERMENALEESRALAALRDSLLPKLISGELRVKDPDRFSKRAAA